MRTVVVHSYDMILGRSRWKKQRRPQSTLMVVIALLVICLVLGMLSLYVRAETQSVSPAALCLALDPQIFSGEGEHLPVETQHYFSPSILPEGLPEKLILPSALA